MDGVTSLWNKTHKERTISEQFWLAGLRVSRNPVLSLNLLGTGKLWTLFRHAQWPPEGTAYGFCALLPLCAQQAKSTGFKASVTITPNSIAAISNRTLKLNLFTIPLITRNHCPGNQLTLLCFCLPPVNLGKPHQTHYYLGNWKTCRYYWLLRFSQRPCEVYF